MNNSFNSFMLNQTDQEDLHFYTNVEVTILSVLFIAALVGNSLVI